MMPCWLYTHGQPATPTTIGKEFKVSYRFASSIEKYQKYSVKRI